MLPAHRRYVYLEQGLGCGVVTALINIGIAWLMVADREELPLWGAVSVAGDVLGTALVLPFLVCLIITLQTRHAVRKGRLSPLQLPPSLLPLVPWISASARRRSMLMAACGFILVGLPMVAGLVALSPQPMAAGTFLVFKSVFAGIFAGLLGPVVARIALADTTSGT